MNKSEVKAFVYKKLSQRGYSSHEMKKLLIKQFVSQELIDHILLECENAGFINDESYLESFIRSGQIKKWGPEHITQKLMLKGFDRETIKLKLQVHDLPNERVTRIQALLQTRYKTRDLTVFKERQKVIASLIRKGFSFEDIHCTLKQLILKE